MEAEWDEADMTKVGINFTPNAPFEWGEWVKDMQRKLGKTNAQARTKYLRGFPSSFNIVIVPEQMAPGNGNYVFPANFPGHHPNAGNPDPLGGQPDLHAMALAFYPTWANMISLGQIRAVPRGMARKAEAYCEECSDSDDGEVGCTTRRQRTRTNHISTQCRILTTLSHKPHKRAQTLERLGHQNTIWPSQLLQVSA